MKFAKTLNATAESFHQPLLTQSCIPYKQWKKAIKYQAKDLTLEDLEKQCERVDGVLKEALQPPRCRNRCCFPWFSNMGLRRIVPEEDKPVAAELLTFAEINTIAVMKLCKKLEKTAGIQEARATLLEWRRTRRFQFMGSDLTTRLRLTTTTDEELLECPICFEPYGTGDAREALINPCGHTQCYGCFIEMTRLTTLRATLDNRLAIGSMRFQCPICRFPTRSHPLRRDAFWPRIPET
jgi:hypothetical protein